MITVFLIGSYALLFFIARSHVKHEQRMKEFWHNQYIELLKQFEIRNKHIDGEEWKE